MPCSAAKSADTGSRRARDLSTWVAIIDVSSPRLRSSGRTPTHVRPAQGTTPPGTGSVKGYEPCTAASRPPGPSTAIARSKGTVNGTSASTSGSGGQAKANRSTAWNSSWRSSPISIVL